MEGINVFKFSKEGLEDSIAGLTQLKPVLQQQVKLINKDKEQGDKDAQEIGEHFTTAINAMATLLVYMESEVEQ